MTTHIEHRGGEVGLVKKPTGFMSSSPYVLTELDRKCLGGHEHIPLVGGRAAGAAIYPQELCEAICRGIRRQKTQNKSRVSTGRMSAEGMLSLLSDMTQLTQKGISSINQILSTTTKGGSSGPVGDYPNWWIDTWHDEDGGCDERGLRPQNGVTLLKQEMDGLTCKNGYETAWDDVTNAPLNPVLMRKAREVEMEYFERLGVYERVPRSHQVATGGKIIGVRWVDVNKGDSTDPDYRSRLVGREFAIGRDDALYAATPPLEALGLIISHAATIP